MKFRITGDPILVQRILNLANAYSKIYPNRESSDVRGYFEIDDKSIISILQKAESLLSR